MNDIAPVTRLSRDLANAAKTLTADEARFLVDAYYIMQEDRKRTGNQVRALGDAAEPNSVLVWLNEQAETLENQIRRALDKYTEGHPMGSWMREVVGIGPVISAGLLAHIDIEKAPTVGHIWRFAGLDPTSKWEKGQKRPWNAALKTLCWKAGQSFMKFSNNPDCFYGNKIYRERKKYEQDRNEGGQMAVLAVQLSEKVGKSTDAWAWLTGCYKAEQVQALRAKHGSIPPSELAKIKGEPLSGLAMLPPGQIDARARRYAVKLFLSHMHGAWYVGHYGKQPPLPYPIAHLGHVHFIPSPVHQQP